MRTLLQQVRLCPWAALVLQPEQAAFWFALPQELTQVAAAAGRKVVWRGSPAPAALLAPGLWEQVQGFCVTVESPSEQSQTSASTGGALTHLHPSCDCFWLIMELWEKRIPS